MRLIVVIGLVAVSIALVFLGRALFPDLMVWAVTQQRAFQNEIAGAVRAIQSGAPGGWAALLGAALAYGVVHAAGPGHGKYVIGGVGLASSVPMSRMLGLALASSMAQALCAIVLVYGGFFLMEATASQLTDISENILAPASYLAISLVGLVLIWRGLKTLSHSLKAKEAGHGHDHDHDHHHTCCHAHGPEPEDVAALTSWRDGVALVASIAIRPCTGAIFLLVIAWQLDLKLAGAAAALTMGLGTSVLTSGVAASSVAARSMTLLSSGRLGGLSVAAPVLQVIAGVIVLWLSVGLLMVALA